MRPHRRQPTRLPHPWDSPGKNTGVGCHLLLQCMKVKVKWLNSVWLSATPWTVAHQAPLSIGFSRQEYWSGVPMEYYSIAKKKQTHTMHTTIWFNVQWILLYEKSYSQKHTYCMISLKRHSCKGKIVGTENRSVIADMRMGEWLATKLYWGKFWSNKTLYLDHGSGCIAV